MQHQQQPKTLLDFFSQLHLLEKDLNGVMDENDLLKLKALDAILANKAEINDYTYLHVAVAASNKNAVSYLLHEAKVDVNTKSSQQITALKIILKKMEEERQIWQPFKKATTNKSKVIKTRKLFAFKVKHKMKRNPVSWQYDFSAIQKEICALLLENGATLPTETEEEKLQSHILVTNAFALNIDLQECEKKLARKTCSTLHAAIMKQDLLSVQAVLSTNPFSVNETDNVGYTPLHYAIEVNNPDIARKLIKHHADVNAITKFGETMLHIAAKGKSLTCLEVLFKTGKVTVVNVKKGNGYQFYMLEELPNDIDDGAFNDTYIFIKQTSKLYYVNDRAAKAVIISDIEKFKQEIAEIMENNSHKYLNKEQFNNLMALNSGHIHTEEKTALDIMREDIQKKSLRNIPEDWKSIIDLLLRYGALAGGEQVKDFITIGIDIPKARAEFQINIEARARGVEARNLEIIADQEQQRKLTGELIAAVDGDFKRHEYLLGEQMQFMVKMEQQLLQQREAMEYLISENEYLKTLMLEMTDRSALPIPESKELGQPRALPFHGNNMNIFFTQHRQDMVLVPRNEWEELKCEIVSLRDEVNYLNRERVRQVKRNDDEALAYTSNKVVTLPEFESPIFFVPSHTP